MNQNLFTTLTCIVVTLYLANATSVPFIKKCKMEDTKCILKSTQNAIPIFSAGIPELGVSVLDPIYFKIIDGSTANLKLILNDVYIRGLKGCVTKKVEFQNIKSVMKHLIIKVVCSVEIKAHYEMKGQLFIPIEGRGKTNAIINDTSFNVDCLLIDKTGNNEKKYFNIKSCTHSHEFKPNAKVSFDNLFANNEVLAQAAREMIQNNPDVIISEVGPPIVEKVINAIVKDIGNFASNVPIDDLIILD